MIFSISYNIQQPPVSRSFVLQQKIPNNAVCHNLLKTLSNDSNDGKCKVMYIYIWGETLLHDYKVLHLIQSKSVELSGSGLLQTYVITFVSFSNSLEPGETPSNQSSRKAQCQLSLQILLMVQSDIQRIQDRNRSEWIGQGSENVQIQ